MPKLHDLEVTITTNGKDKKYDCVDSLDSILMRLANYLWKLKKNAPTAENLKK